jgi:hypothetical protein
MPRSCETWIRAPDGPATTPARARGQGTAWERTSAGRGILARRVGRPQPELVRIADGPDARDALAGGLERGHRDRHTTALRHETRTPVHGALVQPQSVGDACDRHEVARDGVRAVDRAEGGADDAASVGEHDGVGIEDADQCFDVVRLPRRSQPPDHLGLVDRSARRRALRTTAQTCRRGELAGCRRRAVEDLADLGERVPEDVMQHERHALGRRHRLEHDEEGHGERLVEHHAVGRI